MGHEGTGAARGQPHQEPEAGCRGAWASNPTMNQLLDTRCHPRKERALGQGGHQAQGCPQRAPAAEGIARQQVALRLGAGEFLALRPRRVEGPEGGQGCSVRSRQQLGGHGRQLMQIRDEQLGPRDRSESARPSDCLAFPVQIAVHLQPLPRSRFIKEGRKIHPLLTQKFGEGKGRRSCRNLSRRG